jgi:hypothetical protein
MHNCMYKEELHEPDYVRRYFRVIKWSRMKGGACRTYGAEQMLTGFWRNDEVKKPLRKTRHRWQDNINVNPK